MAALLDDFVRVTEGLNQRGIEYAVCGGWAMAIHGFLRATLDIDIVIRADDLSAVRDLAVECGFDIEGLPLEFDDGQTVIHRNSKVDPESNRFGLLARYVKMQVEMTPEAVTNRMIALDQLGSWLLH